MVMGIAMKSTPPTMAKDVMDMPARGAAEGES